MNSLDRYLQWRRIKVALPWIPRNGRVLDVGCGDGALFRLGTPRIASGVGIDTRNGDIGWEDRFEKRLGRFPDVLSAGELFDAIVMLAVVEHVSDDELGRWAAVIPKFLVPNGRLIITTPNPAVDRILEIGIRLRLLDGMEAQEHHGFDPRAVPAIFSVPGLDLEKSRRFELHLNNLFVFTTTD